MYAVLLNPPRKRRRRRTKSRRRNPTRRRRRRGLRRRARRSNPRRRRRSRRGRRRASNPRSRRRRSRRGRRRRARNKSTWIPAFDKSENPGRSRGRRRRRRVRRGRRRNPCGRNPGGKWIPAYARNPGITGALTSGFKPRNLMGTLPVVAGAIGNTMVSGFAASFLPSMFKSGLGSLALGLATAGVTGALAGLVKPRWASQVAFGGVLGVTMRAAAEYLEPALGLSGLGDYLTVANAREAKPLGRLGDYLTVANAREARPLGGLGQSAIDSIAFKSFLPGYPQVSDLDPGLPGYDRVTHMSPYREMQGLGTYAYSDGPIESVASTELAMNG